MIELEEPLDDRPQIGEVSSPAGGGGVNWSPIYGRRPLPPEIPNYSGRAVQVLVKAFGRFMWINANPEDVRDCKPHETPVAYCPFCCGTDVARRGKIQATFPGRVQPLSTYRCKHCRTDFYA